MYATPHTGFPRKQMQAARATTSFERASTRRVDQEFMTNIKKARITQRDVKNEGTSGDVYENKGEHDKMAYNPSAFWQKMHCFRDNSGRNSVIRVCPELIPPQLADDSHANGF